MGTACAVAPPARRQQVQSKQAALLRPPSMRRRFKQTVEKRAKITYENTQGQRELRCGLREARGTLRQATQVALSYIDCQSEHPQRRSDLEYQHNDIGQAQGRLCQTIKSEIG